jgi:hypothetical protein
MRVNDLGRATAPFDLPPSLLHRSPLQRAAIAA